MARDDAPKTCEELLAILGEATWQLDEILARAMAERPDALSTEVLPPGQARPLAMETLLPLVVRDFLLWAYGKEDLSPPVIPSKGPIH